VLSSSGDVSRSGIRRQRYRALRNSIHLLRITVLGLVFEREAYVTLPGRRTDCDAHRAPKVLCGLSIDFLFEYLDRETA
jgi:hypothetical protein